MGKHLLNTLIKPILCLSTRTPGFRALAQNDITSPQAWRRYQGGAVSRIAASAFARSWADQGGLAAVSWIEREMRATLDHHTGPKRRDRARQHLGPCFPAVMHRI